ncbi:thioester domain-containing protein [Streptomyces sp. 2RAF24]|uniref:thioester domain-containing protein n=1 Tax=Streptomyces sp. 2RAF24 TaxID=3232997 RepID=UPI003F98CA2F
MVRRAVGVLAGGMLVSGVAGAATTAVAADAGGDGRLVVKSSTLRDFDYIGRIHEPEGKEDGEAGGLIEVRTSEGGTLYVYCLDALVDLNSGSSYREADRSEVPTLKGKPDAGKVDWILRHGYPAVSEDALGKLVGRKVSKGAAAGATQAAIWRITNHVKAVPWNPEGAVLADYLSAHATDAEEPAPSLTLTPGTVTGTAGSPLGPIEVGSTGDQVTVSLDAESVAAGVVLTDREGHVLSDAEGRLTRPAKDGDALFVKAPAGAKAGGATVSAEASVPVRPGHKLVSGDGSGSQSMALVSGDRIPVTARAKASWIEATGPAPTAEPSDPTGSASPPPPSESASPTPSGTASASAAPGGASGGPGQGGTATDGPTPGGAPSGGTGGSELASTGGSGLLGFFAAAAAGLVVIGAVVVLVHEWRRRCRTMD